MGLREILGCAALLALQACTSAALDDYYGSHPELEAAARPRAARIQREIQRAGEHPWAGRYTTPGPFYEELLLAPTGGFTLFVSSGCGNCTGYEAFGSVQVLGPDHVLLVPEQVHHARSMRTSAPHEVHLAAWGDRRLALFQSQVALFRTTLRTSETMPRVFVRRRDGEPYQHREPRPPGEPEWPVALVERTSD